MRLLQNSFKSRLIFRADYLIGFLFSFFYIFLRVFIWKGLYGSDGREISGIFLNSMIAYTVFSSLTEMLTKSDVMTQINNSIQDGSVAMKLLLPIGFQKYYFLSNLSENLFGSIYRSLPSILISIIVFGIHIQLTFLSFAFFCLSVVMAMLINFFFSFILGMSVIIFKNAFYIENLNEVLFKLFSGAIVPMWFFPGWFNAASRFLPFRYVIFEPVSILLGQTPQGQIPRVLLLQLIWTLILWGLMLLVWARSRKHIMVQGG
jgi:ABC-2 type transport system permease protein